MNLEQANRNLIPRLRRVRPVGMIAGMDVRAFLRDITSAGDYRDQVIHVRELPAREARYAEPSVELPEVLRSILRRQNVHRLYSHQAAAIDAIADGRDVVIVTGTASGKTLCYNLPVVATLMEQPYARALYLFPTKALTQDQHGALQRWASQEELINVLKPAVYDGDTPSHNRAKIRRSANILLTNPDMLHVGMLPYHGKWHQFLRNLRYIVIDELHTYRGIFGSHVAGVLRRLLRLCEHYGSSPQVITASATIANPVELAGRLTGRQMTLIDDDGAPRGRKYFTLWNPPFLAEDNVSRRSANIEAVDLLSELVRRRAQTIVFGKARIVVELVYKYARERLAGEGDLSRRIRPYRGGYLPNERREIEKQLFAGQLLGVCATNALELGIDVGALDAALLVGFPGTICSTWQQAGRAGRTAQDALVVMIAYNDPVDQYLCRHPEFLFGASHEHGVIDPANPHILAAQLSCACFEKPLSDDDQRYFGPAAGRVAEILAEDRQLKEIDSRYYWRNSEMPHRRVGLRTISEETYTIADRSSGGKVIGNVDSISAPELVYPGAVYIHEAQNYLVRELDTEAHVASVEPAEVDYYTQPILNNSCRLCPPGELISQKTFLDGEAFFGPAEVTWATIAFQKIKYYTMELVGQDKLDLPSQALSTTAMWWVPGEQMLAGVASGGQNPVEALIGVRNLMLATLPSLAMCDLKDISGKVDSSNLGRRTVIVYDRYPGGLGFSEQGFELLGDWLELAGQLVAECPCDGGCPACVGLPNLRPPIHSDPDLGAGYPVPNKDATIRLLERVNA